MDYFVYIFLAMEAEWLANIRWFMEPREARQKRTHDNSQSVQFQGRDDKILSGASDALQDKVANLNRYNNLRKSVLFRFIPYLVRLNLRVFNVLIYDEPMQLLRIQGKALEMRCIEDETAHICKKGQSHVPLVETSFLKELN